MNDVAADIEKLYGFLRDDKIASANLVHNHLIRTHHLSQKDIRNMVTSLGFQKIVYVCKGSVKNE